MATRRNAIDLACQGAAQLDASCQYSILSCLWHPEAEAHVLSNTLCRSMPVTDVSVVLPSGALLLREQRSISESHTACFQLAWAR